MENKSIIGIILFFFFVMIGGFVGLFVGHAFSKTSQPVSIPVAKVQPETTDDEISDSEEKDKEIPSIEIDELEDLNYVLDIWKQIMLQTANQKMDKKDAIEKMYTLSNETYKRNVPQGASLYRIKNILLNNGKDNFKDFTYSSIDYHGENIAYVHVKETYETKEYSYILKFIKEKNQWGFAAQLRERGI
ncbi:hypothetical protein [Inediibacterium massiliense]|uniref:hypothetical protein n=1 Tax=Inediibacterium massiliense TaxID=1658111 RepID=UPI0006B47414|nr:hypothetical protein [Inediibacterium massiliense]